jgi:hypothetical protein
MRTYAYSPLTKSSDPNDIYIRLLSLPPGPRTGPITCSVFETRLANTPDYEVLSYQWGNPLDQANIYVTPLSTPTSLGPSVLDDQCISIPASLIPFLYRTRAVGRTRTFWIDSICIDQSNNVEKSIQVARMRDIYQRASGTLIWLGPAGGECDEALPFAWKLCRAENPSWDPQAAISNFVEKAGSHKTYVGDPRLEALIGLISRPYFERCWIVQEVVVSRNPWVVCGDLAIHWSAFVVACLSLLSTANVWLLGYYNDRGISLLIMLRFSQKEWEDGDDVECWRILMRHRPSCASDPRDKIFAFCGMRCKSSLEKLGIVPDYELSVEQLYIKVAVEALKKGDTQILSVPRIVLKSHLGPAEESGWETPDEGFRPLAIPSWAPDWRFTEPTPVSLTRMESVVLPDMVQFNASQSSLLVATFNPISDPKRYESYTRLRLEGYVVATISQLTPRPWKIVKPVGIQTILSHARALRYVQQQVSEWEAVIRPQSLHANSVYTPTGETRIDVMYQILMTGTLVGDPEGQSAFESRQWWFRWLFTLGLGNQLWIFAIAVLVDRVLMWCGRQPHEFRFRLLMGGMSNRKGARLVGETAGVAWKGSGQICSGVVPPMCEVGDVVVLCKGVKLPLVLRRKMGGEKSEKEREEWEFIGDCYVHGVMKGDAWNESNCRDLWLV